MKSTLLSFLLILAISGMATAQSGEYDARFVVAGVDCDNQIVTVDLEIIATSPSTQFNVSDQNYRFSWERTKVPPVSPPITGAPGNPTDRSIFISDQYLTGFILPPVGPPVFYDPHTLVGSIDTIASVNVTLSSPSGFPVPSSDWTQISQVQLDYIDGNACIDLIWQTDEVFPQTFVGEEFLGSFFEAEGRNFGNVQICITDFCNPLPVELVAFNVVEDDCDMRLSWITETEIDNDFFIVEKSKDGLNFEEIARVPGAGSTVEPQEYTYLDTQVGVRNYYRLVQVDFDGKTTVFDTKFIQSSCYADSDVNTISELFPNPVSQSDVVNIKFFTDQIAEDANFVITDLLGREVDRQPAAVVEGPNLLSYNPAKLGDGTYFLQIQGTDWFTETKKFIVVR
ncbi:MAG: T9SS type A sorting domain-containing protein [Bacteroidota bacterium]